MNKNTEKLDTYELDSAMLSAVQSDHKARAQVYVYPHQALILGRGSKIDREVFALNIAQDQIPLLRRSGGGCAVYLDPGNIICSIALPLSGLGKNPEAFAAISQALIGALDQLQIKNVRQRGISDLSQDNFKIGGSCIHRTKNLLYYSTTLLLDPDLVAMQRYLRHPPREPDYREGRSHDHFVHALKVDTKERISIQSLARSLARLLNEIEIMQFRIHSTFVNLTKLSST